MTSFGFVDVLRSKLHKRDKKSLSFTAEPKRLQEYVVLSEQSRVHGYFFDQINQRELIFFCTQKMKIIIFFYIMNG